MPRLHNVFACLVHERMECVVDLVRNLRTLDPESTVLLYNGGPNPSLLNSPTITRSGACVHPRPNRMAWGRLHEFAIDCLRTATDELAADTITIVDSDQLACLARFLGVRALSQNPKQHRKPFHSGVSFGTRRCQSVACW